MINAEALVFGLLMSGLYVVAVVGVAVLILGVVLVLHLRAAR